MTERLKAPLDGALWLRSIEGKQVHAAGFYRNESGYHTLILIFEDGTELRAVERSQTGEFDLELEYTW